MIRAVLKSLLKPEAYTEPTTRVEMVQTHVSWIFLTDSHAYKIKKPVDFGFLNFSTIDRRRFYCNEEVKYNRRLCPDIYEGVVELRETPGGVAFHGNGPLVDYAVKMKRLPADRMLDQLVTRNEVSPADIHEISRVIAEFHRNAPTSTTIAAYGKLDRILFNCQENFEQTTAFEDTTLPASERELIRNWVSGFAREQAELFSQRIKQGFIRECDGDIHLENICLVDRKVFIFDCIEFNERFRCCDTAADVAFLLMDLDFHGRHDLAQEAISSYLKASGDSGMLGLIDFYMIYRAFVRGKVESLQMNDTGLGQQERDRARTKAIRYFRLARGYIERRRLQPTLFITCGLMGSGKSTAAAQLSFELGISVFNSDTTRKQMAGIQPESRVSEPFQQGLYSRQASLATYDELRRLASIELAAGQSVIIDACFTRAEERRFCAELAGRHGAAFVILHVSCNESENLRRLTERSESGRSISDGRAELLSSQRLEFETPLEDEGLLIRLNSSTSPPVLANSIYGRLA